MINESPDGFTINGDYYGLDETPTNVDGVLSIYGHEGNVYYLFYERPRNRILTNDPEFEDQAGARYYYNIRSHDDLLRQFIGSPDDSQEKGFYDDEMGNERLVHGRMYRIKGQFIFSMWETMKEVRQNRKNIENILSELGYDPTQITYEVGDYDNKFFTYEQTFENTAPEPTVSDAARKFKEKLHLNPDLKKQFLKLPVNRLQMYADRLRMPTIQLKQLLGRDITEGMFPKDFNRHDLGTCMSAAALATDYLLKKGITDFKIVEGWVSLYPDQEEEDWSPHTWMVIRGKIFDPTKKQWAQWGFNPDEVKFEKIKKEYTPQEYQEICRRCPDDKDPINENMTYNELLKQVDNGRKDRAKTVRTRSIPVSVDEGQESWNFRYKSNPSVTGKGFQGQITFFKELSNKDNAADIPCKVDCGCPDFMYRFAYNDAEEDASQIGQNSLNKCINQKPQPAYDFGVGLCKHLVALGDYLKTSISNTKKSNLFEAIGDVAKNKNFNIEVPE
jgi:hypothetical protein